MNCTELSPTAKVIAMIALEAYQNAGGSHQDVDSLTKAQIQAYNALADWHEKRGPDGILERALLKIMEEDRVADGALPGSCYRIAYRALIDAGLMDDV